MLTYNHQITSIEFIHTNHYVHRDIKPDNFLLSIQTDQSQVSIIDFGLANKFRDSTSQHHIPARNYNFLTGTARYLSINGHLGMELSRRDDLESLAYVLIYFLHGSLPWQDLEASTKQKKYQRILKKKTDTSPLKLCNGLPTGFHVFLEYVRALSFTATPDYQYIRRLFSDIYSQHNFHHDNLFDWSSFSGTSNIKPILPLARRNRQMWQESSDSS